MIRVFERHPAAPRSNKPYWCWDEERQIAWYADLQGEWLAKSAFSIRSTPQRYRTEVFNLSWTCPADLRVGSGL